MPGAREELSHIEGPLEGAARALLRFSATPRLRRNARRGMDAVRAIDRIVAQVGDAAKDGTIPSKDAVRLAKNAEDVARRCAPALGDLWEAVDECITLGNSEPPLRLLAEWCEPIAELSHFRACVRRATNRHSVARRTSIIGQVLTKLSGSER